MADAMVHLLRRLKKGAVLTKAGGAYLLASRRGPKVVVQIDLVEAARAAAVLAETPQGFAVTAEGERWLKGRDAVHARHQRLEARAIKDEAGRERFVMVNAAESPLSWLRRRGLIGVVAFEAGEKLRRDYTMGQITPRMGVDYSAPIGSHSFRPDLTETVVAARQRFNHAMRGAGPGLADVLFDVCCYLMTLEECESRRRWPRGSARVVLALGLQRLAAHYGMEGPKEGRLRSWVKE
jgi:hypothetical protein